MDANKLWWTPFHSTYKQLQGLSDASREAVGKLLASQQDWLLANVAGFQRPSADARKQVAEQASITIQGKKLNVDPKLRDAAFQVSKLLVRAEGAGGVDRHQLLPPHVLYNAFVVLLLQDLNEIQAYILLKRWLDASGGVDLSASSKLVLSLDDLPQVCLPVRSPAGSPAP